MRLSKIRNILIIIFTCVLLCVCIVNEFVINPHVDANRISLFSSYKIYEGMDYTNLIHTFGLGEDVGSGTIILKYPTYFGAVVTVVFLIDTEGTFRVTQVIRENTAWTCIFPAIVVLATSAEIIIYCTFRKKLLSANN